MVLTIDPAEEAAKPHSPSAHAARTSLHAVPQEPAGAAVPSDADLADDPARERLVRARLCAGAADVVEHDDVGAPVVVEVDGAELRALPVACLGGARPQRLRRERRAAREKSAQL